MGKRANTTSESETLSEPPRTEVRGQRTRNISFSDDDGLPSGMLTFCTRSEIIKFYIVTRNGFKFKRQNIYTFFIVENYLL